jgi:hypothetical protein
MVNDVVIIVCISSIIMVLYGCETWSLTLREKHRLRMSENRALRIFGPKWDEVTGESCIMRSFITYTLLQV